MFLLLSWNRNKVKAPPATTANADKIQTGFVVKPAINKAVVSIGKISPATGT